MSQFDGSRLRAVLIALAVAMLAIPATFAMSHDDEEGEKKFNLSGEVRTRWEYLSNLTDALDEEDGGLDDNFDLFPYRVRIAAEGMFSENVLGHVEIQQAGFFGEDFLPQRTGNTPTGQFFSIADEEVELYQGFLQLNEIGGSSWSLKAGRQEHTFANQLLIGDADFYNGISFDGIRGTGDFDAWDLDLFFYVIEPGFNFVPVADDELDFFGGHAEIPLAEENHAIRPYLLSLRGRTVGGGGDFKVHTAGVQYGRAVHSDEDIEDNPFDWSLEGAIQAGEFDPSGADQDFGGSIFEGWFGWNILHGNSRSRVHVGALWASGDDDPGDDDIDSFVPLFGDPHDMNRLGNLDLFSATIPVLDGELFQVTDSLTISNVQDLNAGYHLYANDGTHRLGASVHVLSFAEEDEFTPSLSDDSIGTEIDLVYGYRYSSQLEVEVGASQLAAGDALDDFVGTADDIMRVWTQLRLRWR